MGFLANSYNTFGFGDGAPDASLVPLPAASTIAAKFFMVSLTSSSRRSGLLLRHSKDTPYRQCSYFFHDPYQTKQLYHRLKLAFGSLYLSPQPYRLSSKRFD